MTQGSPTAAAAGRIIALATAAAGLPLVGRHLKPLAGLAAMLVWGWRRSPRWALGAVRASTRTARRARQRDVLAARAVYDLALARDLPRVEAVAGPTGLDVPQDRQRASAMRRRFVQQAGVSYGPAPEHRLDVWRRPDLPAGAPAPLLVFLPGGAWVHGSRRWQGYHLLGHLAARGWICLSADYRVAPHHPWPAHLEDAQRVLTWAREHATDVGGDPSFVAVAGCSAGGHLALLAGLAPRKAGGPPAADAVVTLYGRYDWQDRTGADRAEFVDYLERVVVGRTQAQAPEVFRAASPLALVHADAPPALVVHGTGDTVIPVEQARDFVAALRSASSSAVVYAELPGAPHGFDMLNNQRTVETAVAVERFLQSVRAAAADEAA